MSIVNDRICYHLPAFFACVSLGNRFFVVCDEHLVSKAIAQAKKHDIHQILILSGKPSRGMDVRMDIFNCDASQATSCGNGTRVVAMLLEKYSTILKKDFLIETLGGVIATFVRGKTVTVNMGIPRSIRAIPVPLMLSSFGNLKCFMVIMGNTHCVILGGKQGKNLGKTFAHWCPSVVKQVANGEANVSFVWEENQKLFARVWERGTGETGSCGSAGCAIAATLSQKHVVLHFPGGMMQIHCGNEGIELKGPGAEEILPIIL